MEVDPLYLAEHTDELEKNPYLSANPAIGTPEQNRDRHPVHLHERHQERASEHPLPVSRRKFLEHSAMALAGGVLFSCTGGRIITSVSPSTPTLSADTKWPIKRVVYLMLENRSFNHVFGAFPGANGAKVGNTNGKDQPMIPAPDWLPQDMPHDYVSWVSDFANGQLDGFWRGLAAPYAYSQFQPQSIPGYWQLAQDYALSDNFFASAPGPSFPNHFYFIAGQAGGVIDNPENIEAYKTQNGIFKSWGCDAAGENVFVFVKDDMGQLSKHDTCFEFKTMGELLSERNIDWRHYSPHSGAIGYMWNAYNGIHNVFHDPEMWNNHASFDVDNIIGDIQKEDLPPVTWIVPRFEYSDHPPGSSAFSHNWVMEIVSALMKSDMWDSTALFITWDEWGGFYDPVAPPTLAGHQLGFRVPLLTVSPYAKKGYIDRAVGDFSSPLKFIADNWGLPYLTPLIAQTSNLEQNFDFHQKPRKPSIPTGRAQTYGKTACDFPQSYPGWLPRVSVAGEGKSGQTNPAGCINPEA
jgi:phospholipase C